MYLFHSRLFKVRELCWYCTQPHMCISHRFMRSIIIYQICKALNSGFLKVMRFCVNFIIYHENNVTIDMTWAKSSKSHLPLELVLLWSLLGHWNFKDTSYTWYPTCHWSLQLKFKDLALCRDGISANFCRYPIFAFSRYPIPIFNIG